MAVAGEYVQMSMWRFTCSVLAIMLAVSGCVREEEALSSNGSDPIGDNPPSTLAITPPVAVSSEATGPMTVVNVGQATASGGDGSYTFSNDVPAAGFGLGTTIVNWTATDGSGATASATQNITVSDTTSPTVSEPADMQVESTGNLTMVDIGTATASDLVDSNPIITNDMPAAGFPMGTTAVMWTATDASSNVATAMQMVTVSAPTGGPLTITAPANITQDATGQLTVIMLGAATTTGGDPPVTITNDAPINGFPVGATTVTWTAVDAIGNSSTDTQIVTINPLPVELCSALLPDFQNSIYPIMDSADPLRCNGCHTGAAPLPTPNGFAFPNSPPMVEDLDVFRTVANIDSNGESLITVKARGGATHTGGDLFPNGANDPDYVTFADFVTRARNCQPDPAPGSETVLLGTAYEQLHRIVSTLGSRVPTQDEVNLVDAANDQAGIDSALDVIMDGLMNEEVFYTRVKEMYNDLMLTDKSADQRSRISFWFDVDAFVNRDYYEDNFASTERDDLREMANFGLARAPLELIEFVIANDRPFTEILTADYVMVNPYSAVIYSVDAGNANFPFSSDNNQANHDPNDFRPVSTVVQQDGDQVPIAGVVGTHAFLARYPSTNTNVNRKRARFVLDYFLGINIEELAPRDGLDLDNVVGDVPTYEDPQCTICHVVMDPIAGLFTKRDNRGAYDRSNVFQHNRTTNGVPRMVPAGYSLDPADQLPTAQESQPLQWMAQRLAADDRFADKTVRTVLKGLTDIDATQASTTAFINDTKNAFIGSNFDFKELVKDVALSDYFRARNLAATESPNDYIDVGTGRILTPEELDRRIRAVMGGTYDWRGPNSNGGVDVDGGHYLLYGGIDSDQVTSRTTTATSLMDGIQERIANQVSCERVATDLNSGGTLFPFVDETNTPDNGGDALIRQNIQFLHRHLLGEDLGTNDAAINASYQLFVDARALGETAIPSPCRGGGGSTDTNGTVLPWMAVVTYLLTDFRFLYE